MFSTICCLINRVCDCASSQLYISRHGLCILSQHKLRALDADNRHALHLQCSAPYTASLIKLDVIAITSFDAYQQLSQQVDPQSAAQTKTVPALCCTACFMHFTSLPKHAMLYFQAKQHCVLCHTLARSSAMISTFEASVSTNIHSCHIAQLVSRETILSCSESQVCPFACCVNRYSQSNRYRCWCKC